MKTVSIGGSNTTRVLFVLAALGAIYFYRRRGGSVSALMSRGVDSVRSVSGMINKTAPSTTASQSMTH